MTEAEWIAFLQRPEIPAFNRAMLANPDDDLPRLVFADWMDENCPDGEVNELVRESIPPNRNYLPWPHHPKKVRVLSFVKARLAMRISLGEGCQLGRDGLEDACWQSEWVHHFHLRGSRDDRLERWFTDSAMAMVVVLGLHGLNIFDDRLHDLLCAPNLTRVRWIQLTSWSRTTLVRLLAETPVFRRLESLSLTRSDVGPEGAEVLASSPHFNRLTGLDLRWCRIGDAGVIALARSPHLRGLKHLILDKQELSESGAAALADSPYLCEAIRAQWRRPTDDHT